MLNNLSEKIKADIFKLNLAPDASIDSVRMIAKRYGTSIGSAHRAVTKLVSENFLLAVPKKGFFLKYVPPVKPKIAYAGPMPQPGMTDIYTKKAVTAMLDWLSKADCDWNSIEYYALLNEKLTNEKLYPADGLIFHSTFLDPVTQRTLKQFKGKIIVIGSVEQITAFPCSQIVPDFSDFLTEFANDCDFSKYDNIYLIRAKHDNVLLQEKIIREALDVKLRGKSKIETIAWDVDSRIAQFVAYEYFMSNKEQFKNSLVISLASYFTNAFCSVFEHESAIPDILSMDGGFNPPEDFFLKTCYREIIWDHDKLFTKAAALLLDLINKHDECNHIVKVPSKYITLNS